MIQIANNLYLTTLLNLKSYYYNTVVRTTIFFGVFILVLGSFLSDSGAFSVSQFTVRFGLILINLCLVFLAIYVGSKTLYDDLANGFISSLLSKNISRIEILFTKFISVLLMNLVNVLIFFIIFIILIQLYSDFTYVYFEALYIIYIELLLLSSIVLLLNTFTRSIISFYCSSSLYITGHYSDILLNLDHIVENSIIKQIARAIYYIIPNFSISSKSHFIVNSASVNIDYIIPGTIYCAIYSSILIVISCIIFTRKNI